MGDAASLITRGALTLSSPPAADVSVLDMEPRRDDAAGVAMRAPSDNGVTNSRRFLRLRDAEPNTDGGSPGERCRVAPAASAASSPLLSVHRGGKPVDPRLPVPPAASPDGSGDTPRDASPRSSSLYTGATEPAVTAVPGRESKP